MNYWRSTTAAAVLLLLTLQGCSGSSPRTHPAATGSAIITRTASSASSATPLPRPYSCQVWTIGTDPATAVTLGMPSDIQQRILDGKGLPATFYDAGLVPRDFCKPVAGEWRFPQSTQRFYDADEATLRRHHIKGHDLAVIIAVLKRTPRAERRYIKWMRDVHKGEFTVFSLKPTNTGVSTGGGWPYVVLNRYGMVVPDDGEVGGPPPEVDWPTTQPLP